MKFKKFSFFQKQESTPPPVIIVSGLPRSGTSMMMKMLEAGGIPVLTDELRTADEDNPKGYYEFERVKAMDKGDTDWVADARGKVVKVISALLQYLPANYEYRVIFMHRNLTEVLASQRKMLRNRAADEDAVSDEEMTRLFEMHLADVEGWLDRQPNMRALHVDYNAMLIDPRPFVAQIDDFFGMDLDREAMAAVVDPALYRNRGVNPDGR
jgi:hypothetical protein